MGGRYHGCQVTGEEGGARACDCEGGGEEGNDVGVSHIVAIVRVSHELCASKRWMVMRIHSALCGSDGYSGVGCWDPARVSRQVVDWQRRGGDMVCPCRVWVHTALTRLFICVSISGCESLFKLANFISLS